MAAIVHDHRQGTMHRNEELLAAPVGVLSPDFSARNLGHEEHATGLEGNVFRDLDDGEGTPKVNVSAQRY
jgi:hypothetical protein